MGLGIAFTLFNSLRVLFYIPQFLKLVKQKHNLDSHSLFMWFSWIFANATVAIYFVQLAGWDEKSILNIANALMCLAGFLIIFYKRKTYKGIQESGVYELMDENKRLKHELSVLQDLNTKVMLLQQNAKPHMVKMGTVFKIHHD